MAPGFMSLTRTLARTSTFAVSKSLLRQSTQTNFACAFHSSAWNKKSCVVEWGYGSKELNVFESDSVIPKGPNKTWIAAGTSHRLIALSGEGETGVLGGGMNNSGQLGNGMREEGSSFSAIDTSGLDILGVACGREHSMLLAKPQSEFEDPQDQQHYGKTLLFGFGNSMYGQLGLGRSKDTLSKELAGQDVDRFVFEPNPTSVELPDPSENVVQVQCGLDHTVLLTDQGNLYSMGWGADGQLGLGEGSSSDRAVPTLIERLSFKAQGKDLGRVRDISSSTDFTLALLDNNQIWIWGNSEYGQCMLNKKIDRILEPIHIPHPIPESEVIQQVAAGGTFGLLLTESGKVYTCGYGALGLGKEKTQILMPEQISSLSNIIKIVASTDYAAAINDKGELFTWGTCGETGRLGHGDFGHCFVPKRVRWPQEQNGQKVHVHEVALGQDGGLAVVELDA
ncbi:Williams-Beuren syndrome chromosome region 16 protein [Gryganskiella cystojenkinii]|nr:Williams-Beuren syndrome chromosome region 16 protein [Gryganskiella cystojenkinii]